MKRAIYAGSFDPPTNGHLWMIFQGAKLFDELIIAVGRNPNKKYTFSEQERIEMLTEIVNDYKFKKFTNIKICNMGTELVAHFADDIGADYLLRGIRNSSDLEYERMMCHINEDINGSLQTYFLIPPKDLEEVSSSFIKGLVGYNEWDFIIKKYIPPVVYKKLLEGVK